MHPNQVSTEKYIVSLHLFLVASFIPVRFQYLTIKKLLEITYEVLNGSGPVIDLIGLWNKSPECSSSAHDVSLFCTIVRCIRVSACIVY
jgi:hypothetical protein